MWDGIPHADPSGSYRLLVVPLRSDKKGRRGPYDWANPVVDVQTRSLDLLLQKIHQHFARDRHYQKPVEARLLACPLMSLANWYAYHCRTD